MTINWPLAISIFAVAISLASLGVALYNSLRDRPRLQVRSEYHERSAWNPEPSFRVTRINKGRRPVILRIWGGYDDAGNWGGTMFESEKGGLRLGEHERHEFSVKKHDTVGFIPDDDDFQFKAMWVEDSLGTRHPIPDSEEFIGRLWK